MKKFIAVLAASALLMGLGACSMTNSSTDPVEDKPDVVYTDAIATSDDADVEAVKPDNPGKPTNYMDEIKTEIHDELFREETEDTLDIVDRIFKHMSIETVESFVEGDDASVLMNITTINAGKAWITGMERYAIACAENLFAEKYDDDATLYSYYLEEFESCVRNAEYITIPVGVEMDYRNHRWEWDINDDVINAITGYLLAAIEGDINSATEWIFETPEVDNEVETPESSEPVDPSITVTTGMKNAVERADLYLELWNYSRPELFDALDDDGFTEAEIEYALKIVGY